jgi:uncharacterized membrane protein
MGGTVRSIPLNAKVECGDEPCGESVTVIADLTTQMVTHLVVEDETYLHPVQRLVPGDLVQETSPDRIHLRCTKHELSEMERFAGTLLVRREEPQLEYEGSQELHYALEAQRILPGQLVVRRETVVQASDGFAGRVGELLLDPDDGHITHLALLERDLWGKKEIALLLDAIDRVEENVIHLKLDKAALDQLPSTPLKRSYAEGRTDIELVAQVFDDAEQASETLEFVKDLQRRKLVKILEAAILTKDQEGNTELKDTRDIDAKKGRGLGAITGGLIGLLAGPGGAIIGALAGAGAGTLAGKWIDMGFSDKFLAGLQERLQPGKSALVLLVETEWAATVSEALADREGIILQQTLTDELVQQLLEEHDGIQES